MREYKINKIKTWDTKRRDYFSKVRRLLFFNFIFFIISICFFILAFPFPSLFILIFILFSYLYFYFIFFIILFYLHFQFILRVAQLLLAFILFSTKGRVDFYFSFYVYFIFIIFLLLFYRYFILLFLLFVFFIFLSLENKCWNNKSEKRLEK